MLWRELSLGQGVVTMRKVKLFREGGTISAEPEMRRRRQLREGGGEEGSGLSKRTAAHPHGTRMGARKF